jgi:hypothetical protein
LVTRLKFAAWYEGNKEIAEGAQKLASVVLAALALHIFGGVSADIAAIISVAVSGTQFLECSAFQAVEVAFATPPAEGYAPPLQAL